MALYTIPSSGSGVGAVKSVQRGTYTSNMTVSGTTVVSISPVNPSKCIVILNNGATIVATSSNSYSYPAIVTGLTSTNITFTNGGYYTGNVYGGSTSSWQLVEYT